MCSELYRGCTPLVNVLASKSYRAWLSPMLRRFSSWVISGEPVADFTARVYWTGTCTGAIYMQPTHHNKREDGVWIGYGAWNRAVKHNMSHRAKISMIKTQQPWLVGGMPCDASGSVVYDAYCWAEQYNADTQKWSYGIPHHVAALLAKHTFLLRRESQERVIDARRWPRRWRAGESIRR